MNKRETLLQRYRVWTVERMDARNEPTWTYSRRVQTGYLCNSVSYDKHLPLKTSHELSRAGKKKPRH